ncbi:hypothetical protein HDV05_007126 [Chytridiales sp. JEL 0842]|nr:hypothetical protein HDV05_007126 [Chytridiales sp. JEL 0842]
MSFLNKLGNVLDKVTKAIDDLDLNHHKHGNGQQGHHDQQSQYPGQQHQQQQQQYQQPAYQQQQQYQQPQQQQYGAYQQQHETYQPPQTSTGYQQAHHSQPGPASHHNAAHANTNHNNHNNNHSGNSTPPSRPSSTSAPSSSKPQNPGGKSWASTASSGNNASAAHSSQKPSTSSAASVSHTPALSTQASYATLNVNPTQSELSNLSQALEKLWELDVNRLTPGKDFTLNLQRYTRVTGATDEARDPLFKQVDHSIFKTQPTFASFYALLDNYHAHNGTEESVSASEKAEERKFIEEVCKTPVMIYAHKYLASKNLASPDMEGFKKELQKMWFELYKRTVQNDSSPFEHTFVGEIKNNAVIGFHNWIMLAIEEKRGEADYRGYILPRSRRGNHGDQASGSEHVLSIQLSWKGEVKPVSSFVIGTSPEYELALYTMSFLLGQEGQAIHLSIDETPCKVVVHKFNARGGVKIGSAYIEIC